MDLSTILACPRCGGALEEGGDAVRCEPCDEVYRSVRPGQFDLRIAGRPKEVMVQAYVGEPTDDVPLALLVPNPKPALDLIGVRVPLRIDRGLLTYFPRAERPGIAMLDLGCGSAHHRAVCELTGFEYVGVDVDEAMTSATLLADGRAPVP